MIRLQCPHCQVVVKIDEAIASQHPVVRCAQCQQPVPVQSSIVRSSPTEEAAPRTLRKRRLGRHRHYGSRSPLPMILGLAAGVLVLAGIGFAIYWFNRAPSAKQIAEMKTEKLDNLSLDDLCNRLDSVQDAYFTLIERTGDKPLTQEVKDQFDDMNEAMQRLEIQINNRVSELTDEERENHHRQRAPKFLALINRMGALEAQFKNSPALSRHISGLGQAERASRASKKNPGATSTKPYKSRDEEVAQDTPLMNECLQKLTSIIGKLESVVRPSQLPWFLNEVEAYNKELDQIRLRTSDQTLKFYVASLPIRGQYNERLIQLATRLQKEYERFGHSMEFRQALAQYNDRMKQLELDEKQFGPYALDLPHTENLKEFLPVEERFQNSAKRPPRNRQPEKANIPRDMKPAELIDMMRKMRSHEKEEFFQSLCRQPVKDADRDDALMLISFFMEDRDTREKDVVFRLFKQWASTQVQKEKVGLHAEELLKHSEARKPAMLWFGENKVISASKEIARVLRHWDERDSKDAAMALIAMGAGAEPAVLPYLEDLDPKHRHLAIEVLARIGTRQCMPALRKLLNDQHVSLAAKQALVIIDKRHPGP